MNEYLLEYLHNHPKKHLFFINDIISDLNSKLNLKLTEPVLRKQLLSLTSKYPSIGSYNHNTGWLILSELYRPLKKPKTKFLSKNYFALLFILFFSLLTNWLFLTFLVILFALGLIMNEIFDNLSYLKDYKL